MPEIFKKWGKKSGSQINQANSERSTQEVQDNDKFRLPRPVRDERMKGRSPMVRNDLIGDQERYGAVGFDYRPISQHMYREYPPSDDYYRESERYYLPVQGYENGHPRLSRGGAIGPGRGSQGNFFFGHRQ